MRPDKVNLISESSWIGQVQLEVAQKVLEENVN